MALAASNHLVLLSGGLDSSAVVAHARSAGGCRALFVDYGQAAADAERAAAQRIAAHFDVTLTTCTFTGAPAPRAEVLGRNGFLLLAALRFLEPGPAIISLGIHSGTQYYDCSPSFVKDMQVILDGYRDGEIVLNAPFVDWTKGSVFGFARQAGIPVEATWSCEDASDVPCGVCLSCRDRKVLLAGT